MQQPRHFWQLCLLFASICIAVPTPPRPVDWACGVVFVLFMTEEFTRAGPQMSVRIGQGLFYTVLGCWMLPCRAELPTWIEIPHPIWSVCAAAVWRWGPPALTAPVWSWGWYFALVPADSPLSLLVKVLYMVLWTTVWSLVGFGFQYGSPGQSKPPTAATSTEKAQVPRVVTIQHITIARRPRST